MPNLIEHWEPLTEEDKECILVAVKKWPRYRNATKGMLPMLDLGAVMLALEEYRTQLTDGVADLSHHPAWLQDKLDAIKSVRDKLPEKPPEERQVVWLNGG